MPGPPTPWWAWAAWTARPTSTEQAIGVSSGEASARSVMRDAAASPA